MASAEVWAVSAGFLPFVVVGVLVLLFSFPFIGYYQHKYEKSRCCTLISVTSLATALFACLLVPADIFLTSFMKTTDGTFKKWANDTIIREHIEGILLTTYYVLYGCILFFIFVIIPFGYCFYEEDDEDMTCGMKLCIALRHSIWSPVVLAVLFIIGAFAPFNEMPAPNSTHLIWIDPSIGLDHQKTSHAEDAFSFVLSLSSLFGMLILVMYMGVGLGAYPVHLIKGSRRISSEYNDLISQRLVIQGQITELRHEATRAQLTSHQRNQLEALEDEVELLNRKIQHLEMAQSSWLRKCLLLTRPFQILFGTLFGLVAFLLVLSLSMANVDRFMNSLGVKFGYLLPENKLPLIIDVIFVFAQKVYPLDYIFVFLLVIFLVVCAVSGIDIIGIWFLWIRMWKIRAHMTKPQALLTLSLLLSFTALAINILIHQVAPQYVTYGSQHYMLNNVTERIIPCSLEAPPGKCIKTRIATILFHFYYKLWFFAAGYYWLSWIFILVFIISFIVAVVKKSRSSIEGEVEYDDLFDEEQPLLHRT